MTVSNTSLAAVQVAGERPRTPGQEQLALAQDGFRTRKESLWRQYTGEVDQAKAPLREAVEKRALERLALKAAAKINTNVGGGIDIAYEAEVVQRTISDTVRSHVEARTLAIKSVREQDNVTTIDAAVGRIEGKVSELLLNTSTDLKRVKADLLKQFISLVIQADKSGTILTPEVLAVYGNNQDEAINSLTVKTLAKFKPNSAEAEPAQS